MYDPLQFLLHQIPLQLKVRAVWVGTWNDNHVINVGETFVGMLPQNPAPALNKLPGITRTRTENSLLGARNINALVQALHGQQGIDLTLFKLP